MGPDGEVGFVVVVVVVDPPSDKLRPAEPVPVPLVKLVLTVGVAIHHWPP